VYQVGKVTKYSQMMHGQPSIKSNVMFRSPAVPSASDPTSQRTQVVCHFFGLSSYLAENTVFPLLQKKKQSIQCTELFMLKSHSFVQFELQNKCLKFRGDLSRGICDVARWYTDGYNGVNSFLFLFLFLFFCFCFFVAALWTCL